MSSLGRIKKVVFFTLLSIGCVLSSCQSKKASLFSPIPSSKSGVLFNNRIIENDSINILEEEYVFNGGGVITADFDNDGKRDLFFTGNQVPNRLYRNLGNLQFEDITATAQVDATGQWATGTTYADVNGDGYLDIYVCLAMYKNNRKNLLYINQGAQTDGGIRFEEAAEAYGVADAGNSMGAAFFDYNKDGLQDLYVLNNEQSKVLPLTYRKKVTDGSAPSNDQLYRNNGDGSFTNVSLEAGITIEGFGLGIGVVDVNQDQWPDLFIANDYITNDLLYVNNGDGTFTNRAADYLKHQSMFSMGVDVADFNNDGFKDIISLDMLGESNYRKKTTISYSNYEKVILDRKWNYETQHSRNMLHLGNGNQQPLSEVGMLADIYQTDWSWAPLFFDADNDGDKDLFITNGFPRDITDKDFSDFRQSVARFVNSDILLDCIPIVKKKNYAYQNKGALAFEDVGDQWGIGIPSFSNGAVFSDLDNDGDLDYVVNNINDPAFVFENTASTNGNRYLSIELKGPANNPTGIGAQVVIRTGQDQFQTHTNYHSRGYMSGVDDRIHFGLGTLDTISQLEIRWPDGKVEVQKQIPTNQTIPLSYQAASIPSTPLAFPMNPKHSATSAFSAIQEDISLDYTHQQIDRADFHIQRLLPRKLSENNPKISPLDANGDKLDDFVISGSDGESPLLYIQDKKGKFKAQPLFTKKEISEATIDDHNSFDIDGDGDKDIVFLFNYNEYRKNNYYGKVVVLLNDGKGSFTQDVNRFPKLDSQLSLLQPIDLDGNGQMDLFVAGKIKIQSYPFPDPSFFFENNQGRFEDKTKAVFGDNLPQGGIATALATDFNNDGKIDLILGSPFHPLQFFENHTQGLRAATPKSMTNIKGWWQSLKEVDYDQDGDLDYLAGNLGQNNPFNISEKTPITLVVNDLDDNGFHEPLLFSYNKDQQGKLKQYPVTFWGNLNRQSPYFRKKFNTYKAFAKADISKIMTEEQLAASTQLTINNDQSLLIENLGDGKWTHRPLPIEAQWAPIYGFEILEDNGSMELLLVGNDFGNEPFIGPLDAFSGLHLKVADKDFKIVPKANSQFEVPGNARDIEKITAANGDKLLLVSQNNDKLLVFRKN
jgi:hypothetical protein